MEVSIPVINLWMLLPDYLFNSCQEFSLWRFLLVATGYQETINGIKMNIRILFKGSHRALVLEIWNGNLWL